MTDMQFPSYTPPPYTPPMGPRPFGEIPGLWFKVHQMSEAFFAAEAPRASGGNTLISIAIYAVVSAVLSTIFAAIGGAEQFNTLLEAMGQSNVIDTGGATIGMLFSAACFGLVAGVLGYYIGNGLNWLVAKLLGGNGEFTTQAYLVSLFSVPLGVLGQIFTLIPCVGSLLAFIVGIFSLVLNVRAMKVTHNLTTGKAVIAVMWWVVFLFLACCCLTLLMVVLGASMGNVFQNFLEGIQGGV